jgi:tetratricopeptide (TPR) repeat protein
MNSNVRIGIVASALLLMAVLGFAQYNKTHQTQKNNFKTDVPRNLTAEDKKIFEDRISEYKNKLKESKDDAEKYNLFLQIGFNEYAQGHLQASKDSFLEAIKINAEQYDVYVGLFQTQVDMNDYFGAEQSIKKAISIRKGIADLWRRYIQLKIDHENASNDEVTRLFEEALKDTTQQGDVANYVDVVTFYAPWLEKVGDIPKAIEYWKKAIDANPESKTIYQAEIDRINKQLQ